MPDSSGREPIIAELVQTDAMTVVDSPSTRSVQAVGSAADADSPDRPAPPVSPQLAVLALEMMNNSGAGLFRCDRDGRLQEANPAFHALNGSFGSTTRLGIPGFVPAVQRAVLAGQMFTRPLSLVVEGQTRHYWLRVIPIMGNEGKVTGVAGAFQDWTAQLGRMNAAVVDQSRFRDFARASSDWFWETDDQMNLTALSDRLTGLLGQPASQFIGKPISALGNLEDNLSGESPVTVALEGHSPFRNQLFQVENASGEIVLFHLSGVPLFDAAGAFKGFRGAGMDVTRLYVMEEQARATRQRLEGALGELEQKNIALDIASGQAHSALKTKNEFLAAMSHELRTPLNAIIGFAESMQMKVFGELSDTYAEYANDILNAGQHLLGLINDVLDVSVIESGEINLAIEPVDLARVVDQARTLVMLRAEGKKIALDFPQIDPAVQVLGDDRRVLQILVNILTNAVKFTPEHGRIGLDVRGHDGPGAMLELSVWDTGPGVPEADQERIFEKFQQCIGEAYAGKPEGTGLGLHISRELARLMGGDIVMVSQDGDVGARFSVILPQA